MKRAGAFFLAVLVTVTFFLSVSAPVRAATLEVGPGYPYASIQAAVDAAGTGDTVLVHNGTYTENVTVSGKSITVRSAGGPANTVIDGNGSGHVFYFGSGTTTLDGFTLRNGRANLGGGIYCWWASSPTINNCIISGNTGNWEGGGLWTETSATITGSTISDNIAANGGGIYATGDAILTITDCDVTDNTASNLSGAGWGNGGGMYFEENTTAVITGCKVEGNAAKNYYLYTDYGFGGGIYCIENSTITLVDSTVSNNTAFNHRNTSEGKGGGIYCNSTLEMTNCVVSGNTSGDSESPGSGGGVYLWWDASATLKHCTIVENQVMSGGQGGGIFYHGCNPTVVNSILWDNTPDAIGHFVTSGGIDITYSDIEGGGYSGTGNIDAPPAFADTQYHLSADSPCINAGTAAGAPQYDYEGDPRLAAVGGDDEPDMGVDEYIPELPDLVVDAIVFDPAVPKPGESFSVLIRARNQGNARAGGFHCGLDGLQGTIFMDSCSLVLGLDPGATGGCYISYPDGKPEGDHAVTACVDCGPLQQWSNVVAESDETNNSLDATLTVSSGPDTDPPQPDPMTWRGEPHGISTTAISMTATTASDASPPIQYSFICMTAGCSSSGWQADKSYTDSGLAVNTWYGYKAMARDDLGNTTDGSIPRYDYTDIETPIRVIFDNDTVGSTFIRASVEKTPSNLDAGISGLIIYNVTKGTDSGWKQDNDWWQSEGLTPNTSYAFRARARNGYGRETPLSNYWYRRTRAATPGAADFSDITRTSIRANWTANGNPPGTQYQCQNVTTGQRSLWNTALSWNNAGLACETTYTYRVWARNNEGWTTEWTELGTAETASCIPVCEGDFDDDGDVDGADLAVFSETDDLEAFAENFGLANCP